MDPGIGMHERKFSGKEGMLIGYLGIAWGGGGSSISSGHKLQTVNYLDISFVMKVLHFMNY